VQTGVKENCVKSIKNVSKGLSFYQMIMLLNGPLPMFKKMLSCYTLDNRVEDRATLESDPSADTD